MEKKFFFIFIALVLLLFLGSCAGKKVKNGAESGGEIDFTKEISDGIRDESREDISNGTSSDISGEASKAPEEASVDNYDKASGEVSDEKGVPVRPDGPESKPEGVSRLYKKSVCDFEGNVLWFYTYSYDENGNEREIRLDYTDGSVGSAEKREYDENGFLCLKKSVFDNGSFDFLIVFENDAKGNPLSEKHFAQDGKLLKNYAYTYVYNSDGSYSSSGDINGAKLSARYGEDGRILEKALEGSYRKTYDYKDGRLIKETLIPVNGDEMVTEYSYDAGGNLIKSVEKFGGEISFLIKYEYI